MDEFNNRTTAWGAGLEDTGDSRVVKAKPFLPQTLGDAMGISHLPRKRTEGLSHVNALQDLVQELKSGQDYLRTFSGQSLGINMMGLVEAKLQSIINSMKENNA